MKTIDTLVEDIYKVLEDGVLLEEAQNHFERLQENLGSALKRRLIAEEEEAHRGLRMSNIGVPCSRKLWYTVNEGGNELREKLTGDTKFKFIYGELTEELILLLASLAGHDVQGRQDEMEINEIHGHRDCVIDGVLIDVKSASSYSFKKFKEGKLLDDDPFGYYTQLMSYLYASQDDDLVTEKDKAGFLVFDKQLGHICLDMHEKPDWFDDLPNAYARRKELVNSPDLPDRDFQPIPDGKSGNEKLDTYCSYCDFKHLCHEGLRTFLYSRGPVFLTTVKKEPDVPEVDRNGQIIEKEKKEG